jgi:tripartite-type tricarboxylate transporter receptor subunit TctC
MKRAVIAGCAASILVLAAAVIGHAQGNYPDRAAQIIVPFPPGGNTDILTRVMADQFSTLFKQPFTVANKPGAGANIGAGFVASSEPDGYTLLMAPPATHAINAYLYNTSRSRRSPWWHNFRTCWWCTLRWASNPSRS